MDSRNTTTPRRAFAPSPRLQRFLANTTNAHIVVDDEPPHPLDALLVGDVVRLDLADPPRFPWTPGETPDGIRRLWHRLRELEAEAACTWLDGADDSDDVLVLEYAALVHDLSALGCVFDPRLVAALGWLSTEISGEVVEDDDPNLDETADDDAGGMPMSRRMQPPMSWREKQQKGLDAFLRKRRAS